MCFDRLTVKLVAMPVTLVIGFLLGVLFVVGLDLLGVNAKDALTRTATVRIANNTVHEIKISVQDNVIYGGPTISSGGQARMHLPHIGLFKVSASRPDGLVFVEETIAIDDRWSIKLEVHDEEIRDFY